jgi:Family of unknown function (DUF6585)
MAIECTQCHYLIHIPKGERRPPWCSRCGADLKDTFAEVQFASADVVSPVVSPAVSASAIECGECHQRIEIPRGERKPPWCPRCGADLKVKPAAALVTAGARDSSAGADQVSVPAAAGPPPPRAEQFPRLMAEVLRESRYDDDDAEPEIFTSKIIWQVIIWFVAVKCLVIVAISAWQLINPPAGKPVQFGGYGALALFGIAAIVTGYVGLRMAGQKYYVYPDRLVAWHFFKPTTLPWDQILEIYQDIHPVWTRYRVVARGGLQFTFGRDIREHLRLGELISEHVADLLKPAALQEIEAGGDVHLGPLTVSGAGVTIDGELQPWHEIGILTYGTNPKPKHAHAPMWNMIHVRIGRHWVEVGDIPNYRLFADLTRHIFPACLAD